MKRKRKYKNIQSVAVDANRQPAPVNDAFSNPAARLGFGTFDLTEATTYTPTRRTQDYNLLTTLYRENWVVQNIIATIPDDIVRKWYIPKTAAAPEYIDKLIRLERKTQLRNKIKLGMYWGRLYGGAAGIILIKGQNDMSQPLDLDTIMPGSFLGLQIVDRWTGVYPSGELVTDITDPDFGLPEYYTVRDEERGQLVANVHHSRVLRFIGRELPWLEQVTEEYWGESEVEAVYQELERHDNVAANIAALTFRANVNYMESDGLDQLLGTGNNEMQRRFWKVMQAQSIMESNFGIRIINKGDAIHNRQYTFSGIADVYDRMMMDVSGACRIPVTKLFGRSPAGMNATGESDLKNYYDYIDSLRDTQFRSYIEKLLPILALSAWGEIPDDLDIDFAPMDTPTARDMADVAEKKTAAIIGAYNANLLDQKTARMELVALDDDTGMFGKMPDDLINEGEGVTAASIAQMSDPMAGFYAQTIPETGNAAEESDEVTDDALEDYDPNQARDPDGKFASGGSVSGEKWNYPGVNQETGRLKEAFQKARSANRKFEIYKAAKRHDNTISKLMETAESEGGNTRELMKNRREIRTLIRQIENSG